MAEQEQVKPLAPATIEARSTANDDEEALSQQLRLKKRIYIQCCGCITALLLILAVVVLVLFFTVFRIQEPMIRLNSITIQRLEFLPTGNPRTDVNVTFLVDVSVKNPNAAAFKFDNGTTTIDYGGRVVGEGVHFHGKAKARRTLRRNVTVEISPLEFLAVPNFSTDIIISRELNISSETRISGRVEILNIIKKNVMVTFKCTTTFRLSDGGEFHGNMCKPELHF